MSQAPAGQRRLRRGRGWVPFAMTPEWVLDAPVSDRAKVLYAVLSRYADDDGSAFPGRKRLADRLGVTLPTLDKALKELERIHALTAEPRFREDGSQTSNNYVLHFDRGSQATDSGGGPSPLSPIEREPDRTRDARTPNGVLAVRADENLPPDRPAKVDRKPVSDDEYELAKRVLATFNDVAGTRYRNRDWVAKVVSRIREQPELTAVQHEAVIRRTFAEPWWTGPPSPSVVYGNAALFERCLHAVKTAPQSSTRSLTPDEMRGLGDWWGDGTSFATPDEAYAAGVNPSADVVDAEWAEAEQPELAP